MLKRISLITVILLSATAAVHAQDDACVDMVQTAYDTTQEVCEETGGEEACYGNVSVSALPDDLDFDQTGDIVSLTELDGLRLSSMDTDAGEWGISLMRVDATLPQDEAVAAVDVILFGNVEIANAAEDDSGFAPMQAFIFNSEAEDRLCDEAPDSGILIQTPQGVGEITFLVNEVSIELGSTAYLQAQPAGQMTVSVVEGGASVTAQGVTIETPAGSRARVPLDADGLADGPPEGPEPYDESALLSLPVVLLSEEITIAPASGSASGSTLLNGTWQATLTENTCNSPIPEVSTSEVTHTYDGDTLTVSAQGFSTEYTLLEPGVYVDETADSNSRLEVLAPDHYIFAITVTGGGVTCNMSFDETLISPAGE